DLVPFEMAVRHGEVGAVMNSYADLDGTPPAASRWLLTDLLRDTWGFDGTVVADYWAVSFLQSMHRVVEDDRAAAIAALTAGLDIELPESTAYPHLVAAVREGELDEQVLDSAVRRILRQKVELGLLDPDFDAGATGEAIDLDSAENRAFARRMAEEAIIPLDHPAGVHALAAPADGGPVDVPTLTDALTAEFPQSAITTVGGTGFSDGDTSQIAEAVAAAQAAELAVLAVGDLAGLFGAGTSGEGCDVESLRLPGAQHELVEAVLATGTPVVLVLVTGRPYSLGAYQGRARAIIQAFMPGEEGASAIAGVLSGRVNPSGRLPIGIPNGVG